MTNILGAPEITEVGTVADNEIVTYDTTTGKYRNQTASEAGLVGKAAYTAKGDVLISSAASTPVALAVGTNTHVLTADSGEATGIKWAAVTAGAHATDHTDGTDDIQNATGAQKGLATAAQITKLDAIESSATADQTKAEIDALGLSHDSLADVSATDHHDNSNDHAQNTDTDLDATFEATFEKGANKGAASGYAGLDGSSVVAQDPKVHAARHQTGGADILYVPRTYVWFVKGTVATGLEQGATFRMKRATTVEDIELHVKTAPTGAALIVDINEAGTTIFSTNPEIDISGTVEDDNHVISDSAIAATAELTMDVDQVGSTVAGADLTVLLHCKEAVI